MTSKITRKIDKTHESSCIILCVKMLRYSHYIYHLQKESAHFRLEVLKHFRMEGSKYFGFKKSYQKNWQNSQVFIHNFLYQNVLIPPNYILSIYSKSSSISCYSSSGKHQSHHLVG